jgi:hypothetical protein
VNGIEIINSIEAEISAEYLPGAIKWADENCANAWSNAIDEYEKALRYAVETGNYQVATDAGDRYKYTVLNLIRAYKATKGMTDKTSFLDSIRAKKQLPPKIDRALG